MVRVVKDLNLQELTFLPAMTVDRNLYALGSAHVSGELVPIFEVKISLFD